MFNFKSFIYIFLLLYSVSSLSANIGINLKQTLYDSNKTQVIDTISNNESFIYHYEIRNDGNQTLKNVMFTNEVPEKLNILNINFSKEDLTCINSKNNLVICQLKKDLEQNSVQAIDISVQAKKNVGDEIVNSAFINAKDMESGVFVEDSDVSSILVLNRKTFQSSEVSFDIFVDNDKPNVGDIINISIEAKKDSKILVNLDNNLEYIKSTDESCSIVHSKLECKMKSNALNILAKAKKRGYSICDFINISDQNRTKSISLDVTLGFVPKLELSINSQNKVVSGENFIYELNIKNLDPIHSISDVELFIDTTSKNNYKFITTIGDGFKCRQTLAGLNCLISLIDKSSISKYKIEAQAPTNADEISIDTFIKIDGEIIAKAIYNTELVDFNYTKSNLKMFSKVIDVDISGKLITLGDEFLTTKNDLKIPNSKIFKVAKHDSHLNLKLDEDDEVLWAGLYWMGKIDKKVDLKKVRKAKNIYFQNQKDTSYTKVESNLDKFYWFNDKDYFIYQGMVDVSKYVKTFRGGKYSVSELMCSSGFGGGASWKLIVITKDKSHKREYRHISVYDGFEAIWKNKDFTSSNNFKKSIKIKLDGFFIPEDKKPDARIFVSMIDGDVGYLDKVSISDKDGIIHENLDVIENSQSVDIDAGYTFMRKQESTQVGISSLGDKFFVNLLAFSTITQD